METHLRPMEHHLPYGITQCYCYVPPNTGEFLWKLSALTTTKQASTQLTIHINDAAAW